VAKVTVHAEILDKRKTDTTAAVILQTLAAKYYSTNFEYIPKNTGVRVYVDWEVFAQLSGIKQFVYETSISSLQKTKSASRIRTNGRIL